MACGRTASRTAKPASSESTEARVGRGAGETAATVFPMTASWSFGEVLGRLSLSANRVAYPPGIAQVAARLPGGLDQVRPCWPRPWVWIKACTTKGQLHSPLRQPAGLVIGVRQGDVGINTHVVPAYWTICKFSFCSWQYAVKSLTTSCGGRPRTWVLSSGRVVSQVTYSPADSLASWVFSLQVQ